MTREGARPRSTPLVERITVGPGVGLHIERREGDPAARPFVLLHGLASNLRLWDGVAERLHACGHTVIALDQRGHGRSDAPDTGYDLDTAVADLLAVIGALELIRPILVGQSWGGNVVVELAWRRAAAVSGIVGVDGGIIELADSFPSWEACLGALAPPRLDGLSLPELGARVREVYPRFSERAVAAMLANFRVRPDGGVEPNLSRARHLQILRALWEHRPSTRLQTLAPPVLLLFADTGDPGMTTAKRRAEARALASAPRLRSHWLAAYHDLHAQYPDRVAELVTQSLADGFFS